jgi:hemerythrin-like metal-binding protein
MTIVVCVYAFRAITIDKFRSRSMKNLDWLDDCRTGDDTMDQQYRMIFDYLKELFDAASHNVEREKLLVILDKLRNYTDLHFSEEERDMEAHHYSGYELHKLIHGKLLESLLEIRGKIVDGEKVDADVKYYLKNWFEIHIKDVDRAYGDFLQSTKVLKHE